MKNSLQSSLLSLPNIVRLTAASILVLISISYYGYREMENSRESSVWVHHTSEVINKLHSIEAAVQELSNAQRGYTITSQPEFKAHFFKLIPKLAKRGSDLLTLVKDNKLQFERADRLVAEIEEVSDYHQGTMDLVSTGRQAEAISVVKSGDGQKRLASIKQLIEGMQEGETQLLTKRLEQGQNSYSRSHSIFLISTLLALLLVAIFFYIAYEELHHRINVQQKLNENIQVQKAMLESTAFCMIAMDMQGKITHFNPAAELLLGYKSQEVIGKDPVIFHSPEEVAQMAQELSLRFDIKVPVGFEVFSLRPKRGIVEGEVWTFVKKDSSTVPVRLTVTPLFAEDGAINGYISVSYDISKQMEFEQTIIRAKELALAGTKAKSEFLANMSHEIRTPMNAIMGMAELLNETNLDDEQKKYVTIFQRAGESLLNIINDILDLSKIEASHFELDRTGFRLSSVIEKAAEIMAIKAHQKHIELAVDLEPDLYDFYIGDAHRIRQVILNLLGNSVKFTKDGEIVLSVRSGKNHELVIEVSDTGIGMTESQLQGLFQRFTQADSSITKEYGGTGLGLNISKRLIELMGGTIEVQSTYGVGTKMTIRVKLERDVVQEAIEEYPSIAGIKMLIVDDTRTNRIIFRKILEHQGAKVSEAENGDVAIKLIREAKAQDAKFDFILVDGRMPHMDGFTLAEIIQDDRELNGSHLMMLTSDNRPGDLAKSRNLRIDAFLVKPVLKHELLSSIDKIRTNKPVAPVLQLNNEVKELDQRPLSILLVDDNDENRLVIRSFLRKNPYKIVEARNGREALTHFLERDYDLIFMDMQMPIMDGYAATKEIRKMEQEKGIRPTPILALTAFALPEEVERCLEVGCNEHLVISKC
jgi:PAS domain S-box-containing protein